LKELSGTNVELEKDLKPFLELQTSATPENIHVASAPAREEANDDDHETLNNTHIEVRRSTRICFTPEW
jgi:hypothetical protein